MSELMQILIGIKPPFHIHDGLARIVTFETEEDKDDEPHFCTSCMQWKNIGSFYIRADGRVMTQCKACQKAHKKAKAQK